MTVLLCAVVGLSLAGDSALSAVSNACVNPVSISYRCRMERLDAWYENAEGRIDCVRGIPAVARPKPPHLPKGARLLGHFWIRDMGFFVDAFLSFLGTMSPVADGV